MCPVPVTLWELSPHVLGLAEEAQDRKHLLQLPGEQLLGRQEWPHPKYLRTQLSPTRRAVPPQGVYEGCCFTGRGSGFTSTTTLTSIATALCASTQVLGLTLKSTLQQSVGQTKTRNFFLYAMENKKGLLCSSCHSTPSKATEMRKNSHCRVHEHATRKKKYQ